MRINESNFVYYLKCRNEKALKYVIDNYSGLIKSITNKNLKDLDTMQEECIDDILLSVWYGIENFDAERSSFKNWIAGIARFKSIDYQRKYYKSMREQAFEDIEITSNSLVEDDILNNTIDEKLDKVLDQLNGEEKKIFFDYYLEDKTINKIAEEKGLKETAVYNRLSRTREKIRNKYFEVIEGGR